MFTDSESAIQVVHRGPRYYILERLRLEESADPEDRGLVFEIGDRDDHRSAVLRGDAALLLIGVYHRIVAEHGLNDGPVEYFLSRLSHLMS